MPVESRYPESTVEQEMLKYHNRGRGERFPSAVLRRSIEVDLQMVSGQWSERILGKAGEGHLYLVNRATSQSSWQRELFANALKWAYHESVSKNQTSCTLLHFEDSLAQVPQQGVLRRLRNSLVFA